MDNKKTAERLFEFINNVGLLKALRVSLNDIVKKLSGDLKTKETTEELAGQIEALTKGIIFPKKRQAELKGIINNLKIKTPAKADYNK